MNILRLPRDGGATAGVTSADGILSVDELRDLLVLQALSEAGGPVGSGSLATALSRQGHEIGEATAGRWLRNLEHRGFLQTVARKGRALNHRGRQYLSQLETRRARWESTNQLSQALLATVDERQLLDILVTRRALEVEAAGLAAENAAPEQLERIGRIVLQPHLADSVIDHGQYDLDFHFAVAEASANPVLAAAIRTVRSTEPQFAVYVHVRRALGRRTLQDHRRIFEAIATRDQGAARRYMRQHIDHVIDDVRRYWRNRQQSGGGGV